MKNSFWKLLACTMFLFIAACGGTEQTVLKNNTHDIPEWYTENPTDNDYFFATSSETSQDLQLAVDKATAGARVEIARMVALHVNDLQKKFIDEVGNAQESQVGKDFSQTSKIVTSQSLSGSTIAKKQIVKEGAGFRAYVLVKYPVGKANAELLTKIKTQENLNTKLRATKSYEELEKEVNKYEASKKATE